MNNKIIVLETGGKHESVDHATVFLFDDLNEARDFCRQRSTGKQKYWVNAEILKPGEKIDLCQPQEEIE